MGRIERVRTGELVYLVSVCKRVFSVGFGLGWTQCRNY